jgi:RNA polymerase sigma-70 factor, ECF subfamily
MSLVDEPSDADLMAAVGRGDEQAYVLLVERHLRWALRFVQRILGNAADAEDVVQTAFFRVWQGAATWTPAAQFRTWFYRVLYNLCMDHFRAQARSAAEELEDDLVDNQALQEDRLVQRQRGEQVQDALASLCYYEEMGQAESAALMGISEGALESLLSRGRAAMKKRLQPGLH